MTALSMTCPHCGSPNEFFAHKIHKATAVNCSHCGQTIGPWGDIVAKAGEPGDVKAPERPFTAWPGDGEEPPV